MLSCKDGSMPLSALDSPGKVRDEAETKSRRSMAARYALGVGSCMNEHRIDIWCAMSGLVIVDRYSRDLCVSICLVPQY